METVSVTVPCTVDPAAGAVSVTDGPFAAAAAGMKINAAPSSNPNAVPRLMSASPPVTFLN